MTVNINSVENRHILIVDDDQDFAESLEDFLLPFGYVIDTVNDLEKAHEVVLRSGPQVILLDVRIGRDKGTDLIPRIRTEKPDAIFVVMTAFADTDTAIEALQKGADDYLRKPLNLEVLMATLERCFRNLQLRQEKEDVQRSLQASEQRFRNLIEGSLQGIMIHRDFKPLFANQSLVDLFGYKNPKQLLTLDSIERLVAQKDRKHMREAYRLSQTQGRATNYRQEFTGLYQHEIPIQIECLAQTIEWEGSPATQFTMVDISEKAALENQLRHAQKIEAIGQLAGGIAHDINNMLQIISGFSELALKKVVDIPDAYSSLEKVLKASHGASDLTRQLLAFSRREVLRPQPLDLDVLIEDLMQMLRRLIGEHIDLVVIPAEFPPLVEVDKGMLEQVLVNLCVNARDAMSGGGRLTIATKALSPDEEFLRRHSWAQRVDYVSIEVSDTGEGIPKEIIGQVFDPFFTTKEIGKGTGLGLSTAFGISRQHNGMIEVESQIGHGSIFRVYIPAMDGRKLPSAQPGSVQEIPSEGKTILIAEDAKPVLDLGVELLESQGYRVLKATNGQEAVDLFRSHADEIDLALLDVVMPVKGGRDAFLEIRALKEDLPIVFCTGYSAQQFDKEFRKNQKYQLIRKPYSPDELFSIIRESLHEGDR